MAPRWLKDAIVNYAETRGACVIRSACIVRIVEEKEAAIHADALLCVENWPFESNLMISATISQAEGGSWRKRSDRTSKARV